MIKNIAVIAAIGLTGCASTMVPSARKLTTPQAQEIGATDTIVQKNNVGVRTSWTSAGAGPAQNTYYYVPPGTSPLAAGVGAGIGQAIAIAILDAAPSARAKHSANYINTGLDEDLLDEMLLEKLTAKAAGTGVSFGDVSLISMSSSSEDIAGLKDQLLLKTTYTLAEDASAIQVQTTVTYHNDEMGYVTPYDYGGKPPKSELRGPLYRNTFTYHSDRFQTPEMTESAREELVSAIQMQYEEEVAELAEAGLSEKKHEKNSGRIEKRRTKALGDAKDNKLSKSERATLLIDNWRGQGSPVLMSAISEGHGFIVDMILRDLNDPTVPQFDRAEPKEKRKSQPVWGKADHTVVETQTDGRIIVRIDSGLSAGSYHSLPEEGVATYGNTSKVAMKNR